MKQKGWLVILALATIVVTAGASDVGPLPAKLAGYRSWAVAAEPRLVPDDLAMMCAPVAFSRETQKTEGHGPHTARWVRVYANPTAAKAMQEKDLTAYPVGSIVVKEKLFDPKDTEAEAVAFMIKHPKGKFAKSDGWEFLFYPATSEATYAGCVTCHRAGAKRDYVFGTLEREDE